MSDLTTYYYLNPEPQYKKQLEIEIEEEDHLTTVTNPMFCYNIIVVKQLRTFSQYNKMGNFLDNVIKSREEWLKKPVPVPTRRRYLNANLNTNLVTNQEPISESNPDPDPVPNLNPESVLEPNSETE